MIITIDGLIATGKSTVAKKLASELGYIYFDTGAMYRGLAWLVIERALALEDPHAIEGLLKDFHFEIKLRQHEKHYFVNKIDVTDVIRSEKVTALVSKVAANPIVRQHLVAMQRQFAVGVNAVFEGRDMGSVVFPNAKLKIFLTGRPEVRAKRRFEELKAKFPDETRELTLERALDEINRRDDYDSTREASPLRQAHDALLVDTSDMTIDEVVAHILELKDARKG
jgi:cytidylate kinase